MKKTAVRLVALSMLVGLVGCGSSGAQGTGTGGVEGTGGGAPATGGKSGTGGASAGGGGGTATGGVGQGGHNGSGGAGAGPGSGGAIGHGGGGAAGGGGSGGASGSGGAAGQAGGGGSAMGGASGHGGAGGSSPCQAVAALDRSCQTISDCFAAVHQTNCCGQRKYLGLATSAQAAYASLEPKCQQTYPACGCAETSPTTDDGSALRFDGTPAVACVQGVCTTFVPDCGAPCATGTTCFSCMTHSALYAACTTMCASSSACHDPALPMCQSGSSGNTVGMFCTASDVACDTK